MYRLQEFTTETGVQEIIPVSENHDVTITVKGTSGSDDIDVVITLNDDQSLTSTIEENVLNGADTCVKGFSSPITGIGIDIKTNGSSDIVVEVLSAYRGG